MKKNRVRRALLAWLCAVALLSGAASAQADKPSPKDLKISAFVEIINAESNHLYDNYERYTKRLVDVQKGPTCTEVGPQSWLSSMGPSAPERIAGYRKALKKQPKLEIDPAVTEMLDALDALYKPVDEASEYFFLSKFNKDKCQRGRELHPLLMNGWTHYIAAEQKLRAFLDKYTDERDVKEIADAQKKFGKGLHFYHRKIMTEAKALIRSADSKQPDLGAVRGRLSTFEPTLSEAKAVVDKERKGKNADALYQGGYEQMLNYGEQFRDATKELVRVVESEAKDPKAAARSNSREISMKNLVISYNGLVEQSNKVMYSKSMK